MNDTRNKLPAEYLLYLNSLRKEGWLSKKTINLFLGWQKRYVKLSFPRIYYAKSIDQMTNKKSYDVLTCMLKDAL